MHSETFLVFDTQLEKVFAVETLAIAPEALRKSSHLASANLGDAVDRFGVFDSAIIPSTQSLVW